MTFEYVLLDGVNDSLEDARELARLLKGIRAKINLIPFNDWPGAGFSRPALPRILAFQQALLERGITATVRWSKGEDIGAACGQLSEAVPRVTPPVTVSLSTLGCRLNQVESQELTACSSATVFAPSPATSPHRCMS